MVGREGFVLGLVVLVFMLVKRRAEVRKLGGRWDGSGLIRYKWVGVPVDEGAMEIFVTSGISFRHRYLTS